MPLKSSSLCHIQNQIISSLWNIHVSTYLSHTIMGRVQGLFSRSIASALEQGCKASDKDELVHPHQEAAPSVWLAKNLAADILP